jgi:hypothetical protein
MGALAALYLDTNQPITMFDSDGDLSVGAGFRDVV